MDTHKLKRFIYPFGDGQLSLNMDNYLLDCKKFKSRSSLDEKIIVQWETLGLVVLKNSGMNHLKELENWGHILYQDYTTYEGGAAPRSRWSEAVYAIDDTPAHIDMGYHNEGCYLSVVPRCFVIGSLKSLKKGGFTFFSNNEVTTESLLKTEIGQKMQKHGVRYVRNMTDKYKNNSIVHKHWQDTFRTDEKEKVEQYIKDESWEFQWMNDGSLRTTYWADAYEYHEQLGKNLYFANLGNHGAFFDQWSPFNSLADEARPHTMLIGDGSPFTEEDIKQIYMANNTASLALRWQEADLALVDNIRWSHARPSFDMEEDDERIMGVTMGMMKQRDGSRF